MLNITKLKTVLPEDIYNELTGILKCRQVSKTQLAQFIANAAHETQGWTKYVENLNYRPERLLAVFPKYVKNLADARQLVAQGQVAIGNRVYGSRMGNRKGTNDGYNMRGSGAFHLTGYNNYALFDATVIENIVDNPELVRTKYKLTSAIWFMDYNGLWLLANKSDSTPLRKRINGGTNGLNEVKKYFKKYYDLIS